jgi:hypothetical protein
MIYTEKTSKQCSLCGAAIVTISMKNPYIDDFHDECTNPACREHGKAVRILTQRARNTAKLEHS